MNPTFSKSTLYFLPVALLFGVTAAKAENCSITIEADDTAQFNQTQVQVPESCASVDLTLKNVGSYPKDIMGHDWVLTRSSDVEAVAKAGMHAGLTKDFQSGGDPRILASTKVISGGESQTIHFSTAELHPGTDYTFFCTYPGHWSMMQGAFYFGKRDQRTVASTETKPENHP